MNKLSLKNKTLLSIVALLTGLIWYPVVNANEPTAATEFGKILNPLTAKKLLPGYYFAVYKGPCIRQSNSRAAIFLRSAG